MQILALALALALFPSTLTSALAKDRTAHGIIDTLFPSKSDAKKEVPRIPSGRVLRFRLAFEPATLDWTMGDVPIWVVQNTMRGLFKISPKTNQPEPDLVEKYEWSDDGKLLKLKLQEKIRWSDGVVFTAAHASEALRRLFDPKTRSTYGYFLNDIAGAETLHPNKLQIRTTGTHAMEIRLKHPVPYFLSILSHWVTYPIRPDLIATDPHYGQNPDKMAFLGAYTIDNWTHGIRIVLKPNKKRDLEKSPYMERIEAWIVQDDATALRLYQTGHLEVLMEPPATTPIPESTSQTQEIQSPILTFLGVTPNHPLTRSAETLHRLSAALERSQIASLLGLPHRPADGLFCPPEVLAPWGSLDPSAISSPQAPAEPLQEELTRIPLTLGFFEKPSIRELAQWLQGQWKQKLGIEVRLRSFETKTYWKEMAASPLPLFLDTQGASYWDPDLFFSHFLSTNPQNLAHWKNFEYDRLTLEAASTPNGKARAQLYQKAQEILLVKQPGIIPLYWRTTRVLIQPYVLDLKIDRMTGVDFTNVRYADQPETNRWH